ncbi:hypothetical protein D3C87_1496530 [compost metagenome]
MCIFKVQIGNSFTDDLFYVFDDTADLPVKDVFDLFNVGSIIGFILVGLAGSLTIANLVFKAYLELAVLDIFRVERQVAGP